MCELTNQRSLGIWDRRDRSQNRAFIYVNLTFFSFSFFFFFPFLPSCNCSWKRSVFRLIIHNLLLDGVPLHCKQVTYHPRAGTRGHALQAHVCVSMPCDVIVSLTILPCVTGAACFVQFDCTFTASAITYELLPYSDVGRPVVEQRAAH